MFTYLCHVADGSSPPKALQLGLIMKRVAKIPTRVRPSKDAVQQNDLGSDSPVTNPGPTPQRRANTVQTVRKKVAMPKSKVCLAQKIGLDLF